MIAPWKATMLGWRKYRKIRNSLHKSGIREDTDAMEPLLGSFTATIMLQNTPLTICPKWPEPKTSRFRMLTSDSLTHQCSATPISLTCANISHMFPSAQSVRLKMAPLVTVIGDILDCVSPSGRSFDFSVPPPLPSCALESSNSARQRKLFSTMMSLKAERSSISQERLPMAAAATKPRRKTKLMAAPVNGSLLPTQNTIAAYNNTAPISTRSSMIHRTGNPKWIAVIMPSMVSTTPESEA
mmetsp:Transcript_12884/g.29226  ORF Transcript_12884/g.29226 Transcript_12884/m.29226 type:complete len:241 (-) Transcript_12884:572-1294(-)